MPTRALGGVLVVLLLAGVARADDPREVARQKFAEGRHEFDQHHYELALELLKESYALAPYPDLLFNIGRCHEELGHHREALDAYQHYLAVNPNDADVARRAENMRQAALDDPAPSPEPLPEVSPSPRSLVVAVSASPAKPAPIYRRWWLWTAVVGVTAVALGVGLGVGLSGPSPQRTFPPLGAP